MFSAEDECGFKTVLPDPAHFLQNLAVNWLATSFLSGTRAPEPLWSITSAAVAVRLFGETRSSRDTQQGFPCELVFPGLRGREFPPRASRMNTSNLSVFASPPSMERLEWIPECILHPLRALPRSFNNFPRDLTRPAQRAIFLIWFFSAAPVSSTDVPLPLRQGI